jgi:hypothetical protein
MQDHQLKRRETTRHGCAIQSFFLAFPGIAPNSKREKVAPEAKPRRGGFDLRRNCHLRQLQ